jgi:NTP pyrophosphatase (non-canonical NTP hydrolase)
MSQIQELVNQCHATALDKGFYDKTNEIIDVLGSHSELVTNYKKSEIAKRLMLITSELGEGMEADRDDNYGYEKKSSFEDEMADVFIRLFDLCGWMGIDIDRQIKWKMGHNKTREKLHGKQY